MRAIGSKMYIGVDVKYSLFLSDFNPSNAELNPICHLLALLGAHHILHVSRVRVNETWIFSTDFLKKKNTQISNFMKIRPVGAELLHADRRTDAQAGRHDEANSRCPEFR